jgi:hypothetical protein
MTFVSRDELFEAIWSVAKAIPIDKFLIAFISLKEYLGRRLRCKILQKIEISRKRNEHIDNLLKDVARKFVMVVNEKILMVKRSKIIYEDIQAMDSTMIEIEQLKSFDEKSSGVVDNWYKKVAEETRSITEQFENDNTFFIDKKSWNLLKSKNIPIICGKTDLSASSYGKAKNVLKKGVHLKYSCMKKVMKFINFSIVDSIDQGRVNRTYFQLLKELNLFGRFRELETWLLKENWKKAISKEVNHRHFTNNNQVKVVRQKNVESLAVVISKNVEFKISRKLEISKVNKAIKYLKWTRSKFKLKSREVKVADVIDLDLGRKMFGCQKEENKFVIWKNSVKWRRYAEFNLNGEALLLERFSKRKKRKELKRCIIV